MKGAISLRALARLLFMCSLSGVAHAQVVEYVHTDALGSVVAISDSAGQVTERREYEPFGSQLTPAIKNGPGYTGHVQDASTGLTYMQQRYYDSALGRFLSIDPVAANTGSGFNRYSYGNNNPYRFTDPDGRRACGQDWDCRVAQRNGGVSFSAGELNGARKNPVAFLERLNGRANSQRTEGGSARYFARSAMPVTIATGREVGADIVRIGSGDSPFSVRNYVLGDDRGVEQSQSYSGPGTRVAIAHTHPRNQAFWGRNGVFTQGKWYGGFTVESDMYAARAAAVDSYVATPNGALLKFDYSAMSRDALNNPNSYLRANDYISEQP